MKSRKMNNSKILSKKPLKDSTNKEIFYFKVNIFIKINLKIYKKKIVKNIYIFFL
jgi:hypothetical protein